MKKVILLLAVAVTAITTNANAQQPQGGNFNPAAMKERQLKMLKESDLKLTDVQTDSVLAINFEFQPQQRGFRDLMPEERQTKMKVVNEAKLKRWTSALKDEVLAKKVAEFYEKQRQQRGGQDGGRPRGNK